MPTTCGFPNCRFRSRYRGAEDNRHFYRVPKKPAVLRKKWLEAIGRTEETIVSQFHSTRLLLLFCLATCVQWSLLWWRKTRRDVPVADPSIDEPVRVELPPKIPRIQSTLNKRNCYGIRGGSGGGSGSRGRGTHHTQGIRNKMCFLKSGILNYVTKHNNCLNMMGGLKQKHITLNSTSMNSALRNDCKMRNNELINMNNVKNNNCPKYFPIFSLGQTINNNNNNNNNNNSTDNCSNTGKRYLYETEKYFSPTSIGGDQSVLDSYSHQFSDRLQDKCIPQMNNSTCLSSQSTPTVCLTNLIQNGDEIRQKAYSSAYIYNQQYSAFSPISSIVQNSNINNNINSNLASNYSNRMKSPLFSNKEELRFNCSVDDSNQFPSTVSLPYESYLSPEYFLSLASVMNGVLTQKFTEDYLNSCKFQQYITGGNQKYVECSTNLKDIPTKMKTNLNLDNARNCKLNPVSTFPFNTVITTTISKDTSSAGDFSEVKNFSIKSEDFMRTPNLSKVITKNELYSSCHYEQNNEAVINDICKNNTNDSKVITFSKSDFVNQSLLCYPLALKGREEEKFDKQEGVFSLKTPVQYVVFIGIDELTIESPILHDLMNLICVGYSELTNLPEHVCQNVSDLVTYQENLLSIEYYQYFPSLKNVYIPECLVYTTCWSEFINLGIKVHIVPMELDMNRTADFIIGIILARHYDILDICSNEESRAVKRPASSPSQSTINHSVKTNMYLNSNKKGIMHKPIMNDQKTENNELTNSIVETSSASNIRIGLIGLGPLSLGVIRRLEKFNYTIRVFDIHLPDGMETALDLKCTESLEEIVSQSDWIIIINETSTISNQYHQGYSSLTMDKIFNDKIVTEIKTDDLNIQRPPNLFCLHKKLGKLQVQSTELRRSVTQFLRKDILRRSILKSNKNEITERMETRCKLKQSSSCLLADSKIDLVSKMPKKFTNFAKEITSNEINKYLTFGINSIVTPRHLNPCDTQPEEL
ncbi:unnamed protein product [Heterobilharzia americana]|nr:unnamed protein product [Heterobilharzia americana]